MTIVIYLYILFMVIIIQKNILITGNLHITGVTTCSGLPKNVLYDACLLHV